MGELVDFTDAISHTMVYTLSDGSKFLVERSASYGDMMITVGLIVLALVFIFDILLRFTSNRGN